MEKNHPQNGTKTVDDTVVFTRYFNAPRELVWKVWTEPKLLKDWWGPDNVSIPECEVDLRVGGRFYIVMEAGEAMGPFKGVRWPMDAKFTLVESNAKLAYSSKAWTEGDEEGTKIDQETEITFADDNGKTKVEVKVVIKSVGPKAGMAVQGMQMGFNQQFDKLEKYLAKF